MGLKTDIVKQKSEKSDNFEFFLMNFKTKLKKLISSQKELKVFYLGLEETRKNYEVLSEKSLECKVSLYGNKSRIEYYRRELIGFETEIKKFEEEILEIDSNYSLIDLKFISVFFFR